MWMNVLKALTTVMKMQLVTTIQEITPALATLGTQAMGSYAPVSPYVDTCVHSAQATALCDKIAMHYTSCEYISIKCMHNFI